MPESIVPEFTDRKLGIRKYKNKIGRAKGLSKTEEIRAKYLYLRGETPNRIAFEVDSSAYYVRNYIKELKKEGISVVFPRKESNNLKKQEIMMRAQLYG